MSIPISTPMNSAKSQVELAPALLQVILGAIFLAVCAQIAVPLPFTPIWLTGQTFGILLIGATMKPPLALATVLTYLVQGALGMPVFAGMTAGVHVLVGKSGGYCLGFIPQVYLVGRLLQGLKKSSTSDVCARLALACVVQLTLGTLWLATFIGFSSAFALGFCPFIIGEGIKCLALSAYLQRAARRTL